MITCAPSRWRLDIFPCFVESSFHTLFFSFLNYDESLDDESLVRNPKSSTEMKKHQHQQRRRLGYLYCLDLSSFPVNNIFFFFLFIAYWPCHCNSHFPTDLKMLITCVTLFGNPHQHRLPRLFRCQFARSPASFVIFVQKKCSSFAEECIFSPPNSIDC